VPARRRRPPGLFLGQPQSRHFQILRSDALKHGVVRHRNPLKWQRHDAEA
jgi:hypothetical protein